MEAFKPRINTTGPQTVPSKGFGWPVAYLFFLALWFILLRAQNPGLMSDDSGEMVAASYCLGLPHPPGYPLYCLLGRIFSFLPVGSVAFRFNLLSGFIGLFSVYWFAKSCVELTRLKGLGFPDEFRYLEVLVGLASLSLFFNRSFFAQCMTAKGLVYMISFLGLSVLTWLRIKTVEDRSGVFFKRKKFFIFFVFFLGFDNHWQTQILILPFMALWFLFERKNWNSAEIMTFITIAIIPLSIYLYLPLRSQRLLEPKWGDPVTLHRFLWVVERRLSSQSETFIRGIDHWRLWGGEYLHWMTDYWWPGFWALGLLGMGVWAYRGKNQLLASFLAFYLVVLYSLMTVARDEVIFLLNVYLIAIAGVFALWGFTGMVFWVSRFEKRSKLFHGLTLLFLTAGVAWGAVRTFNLENKSRYTLAEDFGINVLQAVPLDSVLLADGDHYVMPIWYEKYTCGLRPDILFEPSVFLYHDWGWKELSLVSGMKGQKPIQYSSDNLPGRIRELISQPSHPICYSLGREDLEPILKEIKGKWIPSGLVSRWATSSLEPWNSMDDRVSLGEIQRLRGVTEWRLDPGLDFSSGEILRYYARQHYEASRFYRDRNQSWTALRELNQGLEMHEESFALCDAGVILGEMGCADAARLLCLRALALDSDYVPGYTNLAKSYFDENRYAEAAQTYKNSIERFGDDKIWEDGLKRAQFLMGPGKRKPAVITNRVCADLEVRLRRDGMGFLVSVLKNE